MWKDHKEQKQEMYHVYVYLCTEMHTCTAQNIELGASIESVRSTSGSVSASTDSHVRPCLHGGHSLADAPEHAARLVSQQEAKEISAALALSDYLRRELWQVSSTPITVEEIPELHARS